MGIDGYERVGLIRGRFAGRHRRANNVAPNVWVLVGVRDFGGSMGMNMSGYARSKEEERTSTKKLQQVDLLEVYTDAERQRLIDTVVQPWEVLISAERGPGDGTEGAAGAADGGGIVFSLDHDYGDDEEDGDKKSVTKTKTKAIPSSTTSTSTSTSISISTPTTSVPLEQDWAWDDI